MRPVRAPVWIAKLHINDEAIRITWIAFILFTVRLFDWFGIKSVYNLERFCFYLCKRSKAYFVCCTSMIASAIIFHSMAIKHSKECVDYSCWSNQQKNTQRFFLVCSKNRNEILNMHKTERNKKRFSLSMAGLCIVWISFVIESMEKKTKWRAHNKTYRHQVDQV